MTGTARARTRRGRLWSCAVVATSLLTVLSGCGRETATDAVGEPAVAVTPAPITPVEATCIADYPQYDSAADLVSRADVVVRVSAPGPSRDYLSYPLGSTSDDPAVDPQAHMSPEEDEQHLQSAGMPATAITVRVGEVLKGDVLVGDVLEVDQNPCTARPLPIGEDLEYVLALTRFEPDRPLSQLNDSQAAWQVATDGTLVPVDPGNDLGVDSVDDLAAA